MILNIWSGTKERKLQETYHELFDPNDIYYGSSVLVTHTQTAHLEFMSLNDFLWLVLSPEMLWLSMSLQYHCQKNQKNK